MLIKDKVKEMVGDLEDILIYASILLHKIDTSAYSVEDVTSRSLLLVIKKRLTDLIKVIKHDK